MHPRAHSHTTNPGTAPIQLPNRSLLWSCRNIPCLRDFAEHRKRRRHGRDRSFKSHSLSPHPPRQRLPSNDPIKTAPTNRQATPGSPRGSPDRVLTFVLTFITTDPVHTLEQCSRSALACSCQFSMWSSRPPQSESAVAPPRALKLSAKHSRLFRAVPGLPASISLARSLRAFREGFWKHQHLPARRFCNASTFPRGER